MNRLDAVKSSLGITKRELAIEIYTANASYDLPNHIQRCRPDPVASGFTDSLVWVTDARHLPGQAEKPCRPGSKDMWSRVSHRLRLQL